MPQIFIPLVVSGLVSIGVSAAAAAIIAPIVVGLVFAAGGMLIARLLSQTPTVPKAEDGHVAFQQNLPPRIFIYGEARVAGFTMLLEELNGVLYQVQAICGHRINQFLRFYLNDDKVILSSSSASFIPSQSGGWVWSVEGIEDGRYDTGGGSGSHSTAVNIQSRVGLPTETAYADHVTALGPYDIWTDDHRGDGQASVALFLNGYSQARFTSVYPFGRCLLSGVVEGAIVYDFRDPYASAEDDSTWVYSKNPVLCLAHFECFSEFGPKRVFSRAILPVLDMWIDAANACDEAIPLAAGGTVRRYQMGGWGTADLDPKAVRVAILATMDGWICERGDGALLIQVGKFVEPDVILTDDDIAGFYVQSEIPDEESINFLAITFTSPANDYAQVESDPYEDVDDQIARGRRYDATLELTWVQGNSQARRLGKREFARATQTLRGSLELRLSGINAVYSRWVRVQSNVIPGMSDVLIENRGAKLNLLAGGYSMDFLGAAENMDDWTTAEEGTDPTIPAAGGSAALLVPQNVVANAELSGSTTHIDVLFDDPNRADLGVAVRYRIADVGGSVPGEWAEQRFLSGISYAGGRGTVTILAVVANEQYEVEAAFVGSSSTLSAWSAPVSVDTASPAPGSPVNLTAAGIGGTHGARVTWDNPNSTNMYAARVWRATFGGTFGSAVDVSGPLFGSANQSMQFVENLGGAGSWYYWVTAENAAGIRSSPTGPDAATV